jgi:5-methylcytosine-specific restriction endonuclease McrA
MTHRDSFWRLEQLSNTQLLDNLSGVLRSQRRTLAELVAHLGEVEDRRLHLEAAHGSMFSFCVARLGMSEDEACRRIDLARLARKFPALFAELYSGQITLSVALLLKPVLSPSNHLELLAAARGKCIRQARELVAVRFPKPDAPSNIRKLPGRRPEQALDSAQGCSPTRFSAASSTLPSLAQTIPTSPTPAGDLPAASPSSPSLPMPALGAPLVPRPCGPLPAVPEPSLEVLPVSSPALAGQARSAAAHAGSAPAGSRSVIEPLSAQRYRIQFTADAALKQQLEQARDLLRHAHPSGEFGPIISRALTRLIDDLLRHRFGARARRTPSPASTSAPAAHRSPEEKAANAPTSERTSPESSLTPVRSTAPASRSHIPRAARRAVLERDGLGCSWRDADGVRCGSQAWLEIDHQQPAGKGGSSEPENLRLLCRAHNGLAAERAYGREHMERATERRNSQPTAHPPD